VSRTVSVFLGPCELGCPLCGSHRTTEAEIEQRLAGRPERVIVSGLAGRDALLERARAAGAKVTVRTHAVDLVSPERASAFARAADTALVPFFSAASAVHDRIVRSPEALARALAGVRSLDAHGVRVEAEIPLLPPRLSDLGALVALLHRAVPRLARISFVVPENPPAVLVAPGWSVLEAPLTSAVRAARALGIEVVTGPEVGVPLCVLGHDPELAETVQFDPARRARARRGLSHQDGCAGCAALRQCPGTSPDAVPRPFARKPAQLYVRRTPGAPVFSVEHKKLAGRAGILVLRPTVHCNQDCTFCSANETSNNVWDDPQGMLRAIVRAADRGVHRVSFGGGEPTLAKDLLHYVRAARRLGIPTIDLVTNAVLLDKPAKVAALRDAGLTHAFVSLHAHDERLSQRLTRKVGDHARTLAGVRNLVDAGISVVLNHVITAQNQPYLVRFVEFVHAELGGRVEISFAFVTPQFKVLEDLSQMPKMSDVMPTLRRALYRAMELDQPAFVGSRQGIPPCVLGELRACSDVLRYGTEPAAEDAPQKTLGPGCSGCRYAGRCMGVWRPYERHGTDELRPVPGPPFSADEIESILRHPTGWHLPYPRTLEHASPLLRDEALEIAARAERAPIEPPPLRALPVLGRSRPLRVLLVGSGRRARRIEGVARSMTELAIEGVASPNVEHAEWPEIGHAPRFSSVAQALDALRPEAVIVAAATSAHAEIAIAALDAGAVVLLEKPLARTEAEAERIALHPAAGRLIVAYQSLHAVGVERVLAASGPLTLTRRSTRESGESLRSWSRASLAETLEHAVSLVLAGLGGGEAELEGVTFRGERAPEQVSISFRHPAGAGRVLLDFVASEDEWLLARPELAWRRRGPETTIERGDARERVPGGGSDVHRMLAHLRAVAVDGAASRAGPALGLATHRLVRAIIAQLGAAGAPFDAEDAPRHASSPQFAAFPRAR
jgi:predicted dehydrogenase/pyruvate-formate lyase-activating enzyme